ncbi:glycoside hydrolase domain-containing protein [Clostridium neuense]|uniref:Glycoside hydrolase domain-containing protein n=1 Tax=Clostridium neuense TaxID=1728934 RepID=A0ABW8TIX8_9CLOT
MDQMVLKVQQWLNATYGGNANYKKVTEDGITGNSTVSALIQALQIEIGVPSPDGVFGKQTLQICPTISPSYSSTNEAYIVQGALYCKGYNPSGFDGVYGNGVVNAIEQFQADAGLTTQDGLASPIILQALLNTDAYVLISGGDSKMRTIQQNLNRDYNSVIGLIPTNGVYARSTNTALIKALQHEEGNTPDGIWGPNTKNACPTIPGSRSTRNFVLLLQYALYCNGYDPNGFDGAFGSGLQSAIRDFQSFVGLSADGSAGPQTWASLLVSYGDPNRACAACDCSTTVTNEMASTLRANGYQLVGRYLTGRYAMTASELQTIFSNGLNVFPIFEYSVDPFHFTFMGGAADASLASNAAMRLGFYPGTTIYFAVDYDALDSQVTSNIIPYFEGISSAFSNSGINYSIGIYGPRNVCSRVAAAGLSVHSFVSDMSSGFSGNLGYKLPSDWAFDQIATVTIGSGAGQIEIDKDAYSGEDTGVSRVNTTIQSDLVAAANSSGLAELLGVSFDAAGDPITLINSPAVKAELEFSVGGSVGGGSNSIKFKNGQFEGVEVQTAFEKILAGLGSDRAAKLKVLLGEISQDIEVSIEAAYTGNSITITIETEEKKEINIAETVTITEDLNIELSLDISDTGASIVQAADNAVNLIIGELKEHVGPILVVCVVGAIIAFGGEISVSAVIAEVFAGIANFIIYIIGILMGLIKYLNIV